MSPCIVQVVAMLNKPYSTLHACPCYVKHVWVQQGAWQTREWSLPQVYVQIGTSSDRVAHVLPPRSYLLRKLCVADVMSTSCTPVLQPFEITVHLRLTSGRIFWVVRMYAPMCA
jgi:hypothetical protein